MREQMRMKGESKERDKGESLTAKFTVVELNDELFLLAQDLSPPCARRRRRAAKTRQNDEHLSKKANTSAKMAKDFRYSGQNLSNTGDPKCKSEQTGVQKVPKRCTVACIHSPHGLRFAIGIVIAIAVHSPLYM